MFPQRLILNLHAICGVVLAALACQAPAGADDPVHIPDPALAFFILQQLEFDQLPDPPQSPEQITEAHMARLTKFVPSEYTTALFGGSDLTGLEFAVNLERIELTPSLLGNRLDLGPLLGLPLKELSLAGAEITDLGTINSIRSLETLQLEACGIRSLPDLGNLTGLKRLILSRNRLGDVSALGALTSLEALYLDQNLITEIAPLANLTRLKQLRLQRNAISQLGPLAGLIALEELHLEHNAVTELAPLAAMGELVELRLDRNAAISDLTPLGGLGKLVHLSATDCAIVDLEPLRDLASLATLRVSGNRITDLAPISASASLHTVEANFNLLETLPPMDGMSSLFALRLTNNYLDATPSHPAAISIAALRARGVHVNAGGQIDPYGLEFDPRLESAIRLSLGKPVGFLSPADLAGMTELVAQQGDLISLRGIEHAVNLERLDLSENSIADLSPLVSLSRLKHLDLALNRIVDLSPLAALGGLREIDLASNGIVDITPLADLGGLEYIDLDGNGLDLTPGSETADLVAQLEAGGTSVDINGQVWPVVAFADPTLRQAVVTALGIEHLLLITPGDLSPLRRLIIPRAELTSLAGLESAVHLEALQVSGNAITDLSPIANLGALEMLDLADNPDISDLSPLASLTELRYLDLNGLPTGELGPLSGLSRLEQLLVGEVAEPAATAVLETLRSGGVAVHEAIPVAEPEPGELAMTEFHYEPPAPDAAEIAAGFELRSDFEYLLIKNLSGATLDLRSIRFEDGLRLKFRDSSIYQSLPPGFEIAVVRNAAGFARRYGESIGYRVAGEYEGKLDDSGEEVRLYREGRGTIRWFAYNRFGEPWPHEDLGDLPLILMDPDPARVDDGRPQYWRIPRGPTAVFESDVYTYDEFIAEYFALGDVDPVLLEPDADFDGDGQLNLWEYAFGSNPRVADRSDRQRVDTGRHRGPGGELYLEIGHFRRFSADEAIVVAQTSPDLVNWSDAPGLIELVMSPLLSTDADNAGYWRYRTTRPIAPGREEFVRLSLRLRDD